MKGKKAEAKRSTHTSIAGLCRGVAGLPLADVARRRFFLFFSSCPTRYVYGCWCSAPYARKEETDAQARKTKRGSALSAVRTSCRKPCLTPFSFSFSLFSSSTLPKQDVARGREMRRVPESDAEAVSKRRRDGGRNEEEKREKERERAGLPIVDFSLKTRPRPLVQKKKKKKN